MGQFSCQWKQHGSADDDEPVREKKKVLGRTKASLSLIFMSGCQTGLLKALKWKGVVKTSKTFSKLWELPWEYVAPTLSSPHSHKCPTCDRYQTVILSCSCLLSLWSGMQSCSCICAMSRIRAVYCVTVFISTVRISPLGKNSPPKALVSTIQHLEKETLH